MTLLILIIEMFSYEHGYFIIIETRYYNFLINLKKYNYISYMKEIFLLGRSIYMKYIWNAIAKINNIFFNATDMEILL